ncbi:TPA: hypothetical protein ACJSTK_001925 [Streptococcus agalactiae]
MTLSSAVTLIVTGVLSVFVGTSAVTVGVFDAVSAGLLLNTPVAPATESAITATIATIIPAVCGLWDLTHSVSLFKGVTSVFINLLFNHYTPSE